MPSVAASPLPPVSPPVSPEPPQTLLSRDFILLFCMTMFCNSFIAVFYCFEQWLEAMTISPNWRGVLLSSMFAMVLLFRPLASVFLLRRGKLMAMTISILVSSCVMLGYAHVGGPHAIGLIWMLRIVQGIALAVFSSCTVAVHVTSTPGVHTVCLLAALPLSVAAPTP